jgi:hypothetical protein
MDVGRILTSPMSAIRAEWLCLRTDLLGNNFWLHLDDEDDARYAAVSTQHGVFIGVVRAAPPWHRTPHSLYVRQAIRALEKRRLLHLANHGDAVEALLRYAEDSPERKLPVHRLISKLAGFWSNMRNG